MKLFGFLIVRNIFDSTSSINNEIEKLKQTTYHNCYPIVK